MIDLTSQAPDLHHDDYVVVGLATCFWRQEEGVETIQVLEPIPAAALEALDKGVPTSYSQAIGTTLAVALNDQIIDSFPAGTQLGQDFASRAIAAARTFKRRPEATQLIPLGTTFDGFTHSLERKRILNPRRVVTKSDNVKQHAHTHAQL
jgi:hypothetical protein